MIFISALNGTFDKVKAFSLGAVDYITKPFQAEEVLARVETHLGLQGLQKELEEKNAELSQLNVELTRASRYKDEFLANMSHEFRNPLNVVLGMSEALQDGVYGELNDRVLNSIHRIEESGRHLLQLITDILDLSKIGAGKLELVIESVSVKSMCEASLMFIKQLAHKKRIKVVSMDIQMPEMNGLEAIQEIRNSKFEIRNVPIIALTALAMPGGREKCLAAGADEYLSKPVSLKNLSEAIEVLLKNDS